MATDAESATWLKPFEEIRRGVAHNREWATKLGAVGGELPTYGIHLAVFVEPFLSYVLDGTKTVESRFSINRCAPYGKVRKGDVILLKESGGPVVGVANVRTVWSYPLDPTTWSDIRARFAKALCAQDPSFWESRSKAEYATLMAIDQVLRIESVEWEKHDRRGWVVMQPSATSTLFGEDDEH
jgi:hypothetical protein